MLYSKRQYVYACKASSEVESEGDVLTYSDGPLKISDSVPCSFHRYYKAYYIIPIIREEYTLMGRMGYKLTLPGDNSQWFLALDDLLMQVVPMVSEDGTAFTVCEGVLYRSSLSEDPDILELLEGFETMEYIGPRSLIMMADNNSGDDLRTTTDSTVRNKAMPRKSVTFAPGVKET